MAGRRRRSLLWRRRVSGSDTAYVLYNGEVRLKYNKQGDHHEVLDGTSTIHIPGKAGSGERRSTMRTCSWLKTRATRYVSGRSILVI
jgi:hypothetical protein